MASVTRRTPARSGTAEFVGRAPDQAASDVVILSASGELGGAERALLDLVAGLVELEPALRITVIIAAPGPLSAAVAAVGAVPVVLAFPRAIAGLGDAAAALARRGTLHIVRDLVTAVPAVAGYVRRLRRVLAAQRAAVVHSNGFKMHVLGALATGRESRLVWHLHDFVAHRRVMRPILRALAFRADGVIANSRAVADEWRAVTGGVATPVLNAVDLARFDPAGASADLDAMAGVPRDVGLVRVGLVATLAAWKGHEVFLRALALLPRELPWRGYVVGGSVYQTRDSEASLEALHRLALELGIAERVAFCGFVSDTASAMRTLDVVVHASTKPEPFGLVIAEAMATARAVVVSAAGGAAELFTDGVDAVGFPPGDHAALAARLAPLVRDAAARERLGQAARASALARFAPERLAREMCEVYARLGVAAGAP